MAKVSSNNGKSEVIEHFDRMSSNGSWSGLYSEWNGKNYHFQVRRSRVLELLPEKLGKVLDVGCGPGVMVEAVLARGGEFTGIDISPEMVKEGQEKFGNLENVNFGLGNIENLDFEADVFDQVICMAVLEYLEEPTKMLAEIIRVLKPGGLALITIPKRSHVDRFTISLTTPLRWLTKRFVKGESDTLPRLLLQPDELDYAAMSNGFELVGSKQYQFTPIAYPFTRIAPDLCMRLNLPFERMAETRNPLLSYLGHGYIGLYRKKG